MSSVQVVTKASSDQLLNKFADSDDGRKKMISRGGRECGEFGTERKSLLLEEARRRSSRNLGIGRGRAFKSKSTILRKTWKRTLEGASRVFLEKKHYNRHKRLINDAPV